MSPVWDNLDFNNESGTSECMVHSGNSTCGVEIKGKNPPNLKVTFKVATNGNAIILGNVCSETDRE